MVLHGGCGKLQPTQEEDAHRAGIARALDSGLAASEGGGSAVDAVESAVMAMEDDPHFNCGYGSVLDFNGRVQMDAALMTSALEAGGVVNAAGLRHPIHAARLVMEETDHVLLGEPGLSEFLDAVGIDRTNDMVAPNRLEEWKRLKAKFGSGEFEGFSRNVEFYRRAGNEVSEGRFSTVGAVALDDSGLLAAATSTGGIRMKIFGRIGDSPIIGCGTYADRYGAASATGIGEQIMKLTLCRLAVFYMRSLGAKAAVAKAVDEARERGFECGLIGIDASGGLGLDFTTSSMSWASVDTSCRRRIFGSDARP
jgi:beta-aspartyl-peptidase (threonine type)